MKIEEIISVLKNHMEPWASHLMSKYDREATAEAILYLERVKRLDEMIKATESKACACGQIHRRVFAPEILNYLKTGEEF